MDPLTAAAIAAAASKFVGGLFSNRSENKREKETYAAEKRAWDIQEQQRINKLRSIKLALKQRGLTDPFPEDALVPRPYPGPRAGVGAGSRLAGGIFNTLGDIGHSYVAGRQQDKLLDRVLGKSNPVGTLPPITPKPWQPPSFNPFPGGGFPFDWTQQ